MATTLPFLLTTFGLVALCQASSLKFTITSRKTSIIQSRRAATNATMLERGSNGNYFIEATFHDTPISVTLDTGSDKLAVPASPVQWMDCSACYQNEVQCTEAEFYSVDGKTCLHDGQQTLEYPCCTSGGVVTPSYDRSTGIQQPGQGVTQCYGTGGWYGPIYEDTFSIGSQSLPNMQFVAITENICSGRVFFWDQSEATGIMGLGYNTGSATGTLNNLKNNLVPDSFGLFLCPAYPGAFGIGPDGAQSGSALGEIEFDTVDNLKNDPFTKASNTSFGWIHVFPQINGPWYAVSLVKVSVTDPLDTSKQYGSANVVNLQSSDYKSLDYNSIMDSGTGSLGNMPADAYQAVYSALNSWNSQALTEVTGNGMLCNKLTTAVSDYPTIIFEFSSRTAGGTVKLPLSAMVYLGLTSSTRGTPWCRLGLNPAQSNAQGIFGNVFLSQFYTIFDRNLTQIGFSMPDATHKLNTCGCVYGRRYLQQCVCDPWKDSAVSGLNCNNLTSEAAKYYTVYEQILNPNSAAVASSSDNSSTKSGSSGPNTVLIIVLVVVGLVVVALIAVGVVCFIRRRRKGRDIVSGGDMGDGLLGNDYHAVQPSSNVPMQTGVIGQGHGMQA